ncbi:Pol polyprotein-like protein, partial [Leptotrombidium deliense]
MEEALKKLPRGTFKRYMDDIITGGKTVAEVIEKLRLLFAALEDAGLTLKTSKCYIGFDEIDFLGYRLSDKGLQPGLSKVDAIVNFPTPKTPRQVRSFLGLVGYFKRCIPGYSELTYNMRKVTKKRERADWNEQCTADFNKLKDLIVKAPVLLVFDPKKP